MITFFIQEKGNFQIFIVIQFYCFSAVKELGPILIKALNPCNYICGVQKPQ
jgi:hypothetical protein